MYIKDLFKPNHHHWHNSPLWAKAFFRSFWQLSLFLAAFLQFLSPNFMALFKSNRLSLTWILRTLKFLIPMEYYILTQIPCCVLICVMSRDIFTVVRTTCFILYCTTLLYEYILRLVHVFELKRIYGM